MSGSLGEQLECRGRARLVIRGSLCLWLVWLSFEAAAASQELEPRAYAPSPVGVTFVVGAAGHLRGDILTDPSIAIDDLHAKVNTVTFGYGRTFPLAGHQALLLAALPIARFEGSGRIGDHRETVTRTGQTDLHLKFSIGLVGAPALRPAEFARASRRAAIGASITVVSPVGQYDSQKLINLGTNRWGFKPEIGVSHPVGRWTIEGYAGVWLYTANDAFYPGSARRTQAALTSLQAHLGYELGRHAWVAFDSTWYGGGQSAVNGVLKDDRKRNARVGATLSIPTWQKQSIKFSYSAGATTRVGSSFKAVGVSWQVTMF
jgi:hypothetical protein